MSRRPHAQLESDRQNQISVLDLITISIWVLIACALLGMAIGTALFVVTS